MLCFPAYGLWRLQIVGNRWIDVSCVHSGAVLLNFVTVSQLKEVCGIYWTSILYESSECDIRSSSHTSLASCHVQTGIPPLAPYSDCCHWNFSNRSGDAVTVLQSCINITKWTNFGIWITLCVSVTYMAFTCCLWENIIPDRS